MNALFLDTDIFLRKRNSPPRFVSARTNTSFHTFCLSIFYQFYSAARRPSSIVRRLKKSMIIGVNLCDPSIVSRRSPSFAPLRSFRETFRRQKILVNPIIRYIRVLNFHQNFSLRQGSCRHEPNTSFHTFCLPIFYQFYFVARCH
jgi:hypothetical protein